MSRKANGRGPNKYMSAHSVGLRLRRLRADTDARRQAKQLYKDGEVFAAVDLLVESGDLTLAHRDAYVRWAAEVGVPSGAPADNASVEDLV